MKRFENISILRAFAMMAVVLYHSFCYYSIWNVYGREPLHMYGSITSIIGAFHMPIFIFISGFLFGNSSLLNKAHQKINIDLLKSKLLRLYVPAILWGGGGNGASDAGYLPMEETNIWRESSVVFSYLVLHIPSFCIL